MTRFTAAALAALLAGAAVAKDTAMLGMVLEPPVLDPTAGAAAAIDEVVYANVFEGLTRIAEDGSVQPALAQSWDVSEDGLSVTFHLREGVTFHDGADFDASDVVFSLERATAEGSQNAQKGLFAAIESVEAVNPLTVRVTLKQPTGAFLFNMGWGDAVMVDPASAETNAAMPVGTGPFRFGEWRKGDRVTLERNDAYWGQRPALAGATFKFIADPTAAAAALLAGDVDAFPNFPAPELIPQFEADPRFTVTQGTTEGETILSMNNTAKPLDDIRVRRAIAHAVNRAEIVEGAMFGVGTPIGSHVAPHNPAYVDLTGVAAHDPDAAKALLAEAGAEGLTLRLMLPPPSYARRGGEIVAAQLRAVGIETEIEALEWAQWLERVFKGRDYDLTIVSHTEPNDIGIYARDDYYFNYDNPDFKALMATLDAEIDPTKRAELLRAAQAMIAEDQPVAFLFQLGKTMISANGLKGLWANAPTQANDLTGAHWE